MWLASSRSLRHPEHAILRCPTSLPEIKLPESSRGDDMLRNGSSGLSLLHSGLNFVPTC